MYDDKLDKRLLDFNRRYQEQVYSNQKTKLEKIRGYFDNFKKCDFKQIIEYLRYRKYAKTNFTTNGNISFNNGGNQKTDGLKVAVYSCIVGHYDGITDPVYTEPGVTYLMYTDQEIPIESVWQKVDVTKIRDYNRMSNVMLNRKIKILQTERLQEFDYTVYVDGNIEIVTGVSPLIAKMKGCGFGVHYHRTRDCIYDEMVAVKHLKRICGGGDMVEQVNNYRDNGFPPHFGLYENSILIRDNRDAESLRLMELWWDEYCKYPTRDQLSLPYVIWKNHFDRKKILIMGNDIERNPRFNRIKKHL